MARADQVNLKLESLGGQQSGTDYVYPYNFSVNNSTILTPLMCISFTKDIVVGESWTATVEPISGNATYVEAAYLYTLANAHGASTTTIAEAQWANWELFDPNDPNLLNSVPDGDQRDISTLLSQAALFAKNNVNTNIYSNLDIYIPVNGSQSTGGIPQSLIGYSLLLATPEPGTLILMGSGLLGVAGFLYLKRHSAS